VAFKKLSSTPEDLADIAEHGGEQSDGFVVSDLNDREEHL